MHTPALPKLRTRLRARCLRTYLLSQSPSTMPLQTDTTSNLLKGLKILQSLGEAIPAGGIIKSVAGVGIIVLETAQKVQVNKKECSAIAERAATNIIMLHSTLNADDLLSDDLRERLQSYLEVLEDVVETPPASKTTYRSAWISSTKLIKATSFNSR
ncbi:hypothetical protein SISSUDRAFT_924842 [Sistotremastrum suecicum HHB10207 ss-3]|uniref:Uncharacterized protein n=1 Tax=Sistotremastrum suecicum HHB10207 ss-3 TaxID=1314776 RepID=A0A166BVF5_9AGAM|nr:hypothetical protein SISSUDRAFT_924842 [Sistotremastrum suecicum HHB10207 ss-3]